MNRKNILAATGKAALALGVFILTIMGTALAAPTISIEADNDRYRPGDRIEVSLSARNFDRPVAVAVYVGLFSWDGSLWTKQPKGFSQMVLPWIEEITLTCPFSMDLTPILHIDVPCDVPPVGPDGKYSFAAVLADPDTSEFISDISFAPFTIGCVGHSDYYVDPETGDDSADGSKDSPWKTITKALLSVEGSEKDPVTVRLAEAIYAPSTSGEKFPLVMRSFVSIVGGDRATTVLDAEGTARVITCEGVTDLALEGLTITGGLAADDEGFGGGISCDGSSLRIENNIVSGNQAQNTNGMGSYGGGIHCYDSSVVIVGNRIAGNLSEGAGGAIYCCRSWVTIKNNTITDNSADVGGGVLGSAASGTIAGNLISGNYSTIYGGGIYWEGDYLPTIRDNIIIENTADKDGGGVYISGCFGTFRNNLLVGNSSFFGGAVYCYAGCVKVVNCTVADNIGAGIMGYDHSQLAVENCIVWENGNYEIFMWLTGSITVNHSSVQDGYQGQGNIQNDPMFVEGPLGDYYLHPDSPCIDAGSQSASAAGLPNRTTQADGTPDTGQVDMGFHYPPPALPTTRIE